MARFFITASNIFGGVAYLSRDDAAHLKVLRIRDGEVFTVCDGEGTDYICKKSSESEDGAAVEIIEKVPSAGEPSVHCAVYAAFPKSDKAETIIQKCVELGAAEIVFFPSSRCVSRPDEKSLLKKTARWQKIAEQAAKQSGRGRIPKISALPSFKDAVISACNFELPLFLYEQEQSLGIRSAIEAAGDFKTVAVMTGSEGGFDESEAEFAVNAGMKSVTVGPRILRCETAPMCAVAAVMLMTGNMD